MNGLSEHTQCEVCRQLRKCESHHVAKRFYSLDFVIDVCWECHHRYITPWSDGSIILASDSSSTLNAIYAGSFQALELCSQRLHECELMNSWRKVERVVNQRSTAKLDGKTRRKRRRIAPTITDDVSGYIAAEAKFTLFTINQPIVDRMFIFSDLLSELQIWKTYELSRLAYPSIYLAWSYDNPNQKYQAWKDSQDDIYDDEINVVRAPVNMTKELLTQRLQPLREDMTQVWIPYMSQFLTWLSDNKTTTPEFEVSR